MSAKHKSNLPDNENEATLLSRSSVATRFGVAPHTVTRWANEGILPYVLTLGGQRRYPAAEVERLLSIAWERGLTPGRPPRGPQASPEVRGKMST